MKVLASEESVTIFDDDDLRLVDMFVSGEGNDACVVIAPFARIFRIAADDMDMFCEIIRVLGEAAYCEKYLKPMGDE